ncbi:hypothetical protein CPB83DRAFT_87453 [Crepidotus variabilis]|uniref:Uncharacterized protein n=1 Tax=Crepidotus variabilis TaxID=179855 RepID=A0A9P6EMI9_9AGAR|nr:hypothetical protein CPB83DRAFT_87453 [Crepidotus variabilis]
MYWLNAITQVSMPIHPLSLKPISILRAYICGYSGALQTASLVAKRFGSHKKAKEYLLKALLCRRYLIYAYPGTSLELDLAYCWEQLALIHCSVMPAEEALGWIDKGLRIYRRLYGYDPTKYTSDLFNCLNLKAQILGDLEREEEAHKCLLEVLDVDTQGVDQINIAHSLVGTSTRLSDFGRKQEAIILRIRTVEIYRVIQKKPNQYEADLYLDLALDYKSENQIDDAIKAANVAFQQCLALALDAPSEHALSLGECLSLWISLLVSSNPTETHQVFDRVTTTLNLYDSLVRHDTTLYEAYDTIMDFLVCCSDNPSVAIPVSSEIVERLRGLAQVHPEIVGMALLEQLEYHGHLLSKFGHLKKAADWMEGLGTDYHDPAAIDAEICEWYTSLLISLADILKDRGDIEQARMVLKRAAETGRTHLHISPFLAFIAKSHEVDIVACSGDKVSALKLSAECLSFALQTYPSHSIKLAFFQHQHSQFLAVNEKYEDALSVARNSAITMTNYIADNPSTLDKYQFYWPSEFWRTWASCLSDTKDLAQASDVAERSAKEAKRVETVNQKKVYLSKKSERYHGLALFTFGSIQLFSGNADDALKSLEEAREMWMQRSEVRKFDLRNLVLTLWALGFTYCLLGRHNNGVSAHQELKMIIHGLKYAEPAMHRVVTVALDQERRRPSWVHFLESVRGHLMDVVPKARSD